jgi:ferric-dicitrate binding protein FerR (iron transport regulator)
MKTAAAHRVMCVCLLVYFLLIPVVTFALPDESGQRAGEISRVIPAVKIARGSNSLDGTEKTPIYWKDVVNTMAGGRARMSLDDGSVLNLGSNSNMNVVKHDAGAQQTELTLGLGKMRVQAQKISHSTGKFEVRTPAGVAGVIGTDFYVGYENKLMTVIVFAGRVRVCSLGGVCVEVGEGDSITLGGGSGAVTHASAAMKAEAMRSTSVEPGVEAGLIETGPLGIVVKATTARVGNSTGTKGAAVYSGDSLSTDIGGVLIVRVGTLTVELQGDSAARIYRASYGAVVDLGGGSVIYQTAGDPQNVQIVASDTRITPGGGGATAGRVTLENGCYLKIQSRRGPVHVADGRNSHVVDSGRTYHLYPQNFVIASQSISPDSTNYHHAHLHRACGTSEAKGLAPFYFPGNTNSGSTTSVPEPSSLDMLAIGILVLVGVALKRLLA